MREPYFTPRLFEFLIELKAHNTRPWFEANRELVNGVTHGWARREGWAAREWSPIEGGEHLGVRAAAGLFDLTRAGVLDQVQLAVAGVTLTLFVPCVAQFLMMMKERGVRTALGMLAFITPFAFGVGYLLNLALRGLR